MKIIKRIIKKMVFMINEALMTIYVRLSKPCLIIFCDGGISSQMYQYMNGQVLIDRGYRVKYDLTFYDNNPRDMFGIDDRSYVLDKICQVDRSIKASTWEIEYYRRHFINELNQPPHLHIMSLNHKWTAPCYLDKYYTCAPEEYIPYLKKYIKLKAPEEVLDKRNLEYYREIKSCNSVGVHIRRGDMVKSTDQWKAPTIDYFVNAMKSIEFKGMNFYLFSDEIEWVKSEILPRVEPECKCVIMDGNSSDKGYMDLMLLSSCKYQIASQGSFGLVAYVLNDFDEKLIMFPVGGRNGVIQRLASEKFIPYTLNGQRLSEDEIQELLARE